ncbi:MAG TPA: hypothetical protein VG892_04620, partial [Terriglobales bacterium]|nr:hypothetical protein [Terriglobales bacterium]
SRIESAAMPRFGQQEAYSFEHSLKSGPGGIYDTDFLVGTLTVLHGLQNSQGTRGNELRGNLKDRILTLEERGMLTASDGRELRRATEFLRALDHAIRLATGRKTLLASERVRQSTSELAGRFLNGGTDYPSAGGDIFSLLAETRRSLRERYSRLMAQLIADPPK